MRYSSALGQGYVAPRGLIERDEEVRPAAQKRRSLVIVAVIATAFLLVGGQLVRLGLKGQLQISSNISAPLARNFARPDILDRQGRLLATDVEAPSLYADPTLILDRNEVVEKLRTLIPDLDEAALASSLADKSRRFVWIKRGIAPKLAQEIHDLGLPGLAFQRELKRTYPAGRLAGHVLGAVNVDNKGVTGIERYIDDVVGLEPVLGATLTDRAPVRLSLDIGVQHSLEDELADAKKRYGAEGAAGVVLDVRTGEVLASASLPDVDPARVSESLEQSRIDKISAGSYELGSIFKTLTIAMALDRGEARPDTVIDVRKPLTAGPYTITDLHPVGRPLTVTEIFIRSSNVGAGMLALDAGSDNQREFLRRLGVIEPLKTEVGPVAAPRIPERWERAETITIAYGHGIAVAPLQFAAATATLVNGGTPVRPTFVVKPAGSESSPATVLKPGTSAAMRTMMRQNVTDPAGTGRRAAVDGYEVGGKTGTAEMPGKGGYKERSVISSFVAAFPIDKPQYVALVLLFEPKSGEGRKGELTAGTNAAPATGRLIARIAPILGVRPES